MVDYVDITPKNIDPAPSEQKEKQFVFQETEWHQIKENPSGLTKEGVAEKIKAWENSGNPHVLAKYKTMLAQCTKLTASGETEKGEIILSRNKKGNPNWKGLKTTKKTKKKIKE